MQATISDNLRVVERAWVDSINKRSKDAFLDLHGDDVSIYDPTLKGVKGKAALLKMWNDILGTFPDYQVRKIRSFAQDDWVCLEAEESGTMKGPIHAGPREIPPTGKSFNISSSIIFKVEKNRIQEIRLYYDVLGLMAQLGLGP